MSKVCGEHAVSALLKKNNMRNICLYVEKQKQTQYRDLMAKAASIGQVNVVNTVEDFPKSRHQGIMATFDFKFQDLEDVPKHRLLMLDRIQDPHNFGACLRSAAAFGVDAVIVPKREHAPMSEVVHQVSCGGSLIVPIVQVGNLNQTMAELKDQGVWFVATDEFATDNIEVIDQNMNICLVMGSEGQGVKKRLKEMCDYQISIHTHPNLSTLNVSVATGILLHAFYQAR